MSGSCARVVINFNAPDLGALLAQTLQADQTAARVVRFADTECDVVIDGDFSDLALKNVVLVAQFGGQFAAWSVNDFLLALYFLASRIRHVGVSSLQLVLPYYPYARQHIGENHGGVAGSWMIGQLYKAAGVDRIITFDLHNQLLAAYVGEHLVAISCDSFWAREVKEFIAKRSEQNYVLVAPDQGAALRVQALSKELSIPVCFIAKRRIGINEASAVALSGEVSGRYALILDDIIDTGRTAVSAANLVLRHGAIGVSGFFTHAVLSATSLAVLQLSEFDEVVVSDTLHRPMLMHPSLRYVSINSFISCEVRGVYENVSPAIKNMKEFHGAGVQ